MNSPNDGLIYGRKAIMQFLKVRDWGTVKRRMKAGLPVTRIVLNAYAVHVLDCGQYQRWVRGQAQGAHTEAS